MGFYLDDLTIKLSGINVADILSSWTWLVKDLDEVLLISKLGDLFFLNKGGCVYWLATDTCSLTQVAGTKTEFDELLKDDANVDDWFLPKLLEELDQAGQHLSFYQVYSYIKLPVLGGDYIVDNIDPVDVIIHFNLTGQIGEQIKDLPNGAKVKIKVVD